MNEVALRAAQRRDLKVSSADSLVDRLAKKYSDRITGYFKLAQPTSLVEFPDALSEARRLAEEDVAMLGNR